VSVEDSPQLVTARQFFASVPDELRTKLIFAADAATRVVTRLEPQLENPGDNIPLYLSIQTDSKGQKGDVRDVLCIRKRNEWEVGLSCKHNHNAVKHNRLSPRVDFGKKWLGIPCSNLYFATVNPLFDELRAIMTTSKSTILWDSLERKEERFYIPVLQAFIDELRRLDRDNPDIIPMKLIQYLIGNRDFYKVITDDRRKTTRVEAVNLYGTLNRSSCGVKSIVNVPRLKLPTQFHSIDIKRDSVTTAVIVCDEGWTLSMRIHNGDKPVVDSLKFDIELGSLPNSMHAQVEPW
jgi:hypothetical protein